MKKLRIEYGSSVFSLPRESLMAAVTEAGEFQLRVLLLAASDDALRSDLDKCCAEICAKLDCTQTALERALKYWSEHGVMSVVETVTVDEIVTTSVVEKPVAKPFPAPTLPSYGEGAAADIIEKNPELPGIIEVCIQLLGKLLTPAENAIIVGLYDHLRLDGEYIVTLVSHCKNMGKTSLRYIEKTALSLYDEGVDNVEALKAYIKRREMRDDNLSKIRTMIGAGAREFTAKEKKAFEAWLDDWRFDIEVIRCAYEVTVDKIGEPSVAYMNKVLENWHKSGITTPEAVAESLEAYKKNKAESAQKESGFETDEFFEAALKRSDKYLGG
ncbi:MAG: DnaD domain protein [Ruminococcaceae bacterium]|nr:DnaD domain protein [Oscillospiraceae bacterium]